MRRRKLVQSPTSTTTINGPAQDTHSYDGHLKDRLVNVTSTTATKNDKINSFNDLKNKIGSITSPLVVTALKAIDLIINSIGTSNYDPTNNVHADDLLYLIIDKLKDPSIDVLMDVIIQLSDIITSGPCPQGRCTRLAQIYFSLYDDLTTSPTQYPNLNEF